MLAASARPPRARRTPPRQQPPRPPATCRGVLARLRGKVPPPGEVLDSTIDGPRFKNSRDARGPPVTSEADLTTALLKRLRDLEADARSQAAVLQQVSVDKKKLEDK